MNVRFYMDVHIPQAITDALRRRGIDVLRAAEDGAHELPDDELLERATELGRVLVTQDIRFKVLAHSWQEIGRPFAGLIFGHQLHGTIGAYVEDLSIVALASDAEEWMNMVDHIPY